MSHFVYIIYSYSRDRYYIGETVNPTERLSQHNSGYYSGASTKGVSNWTLFLTIECSSRSQALNLEKFIKSMKNRKFYHRLKNEPELVKGLLMRFSL